jgi:hypothetical protein
MKKSELPFQIRIATPCPARWEDMGGGDKVRFCDQCKKNVYNISAMTTAEATALLESNPGRLCGRIYQRADGTVQTEDCPVGVARHWRRIKRRVAGVVAMLLFVVLGTAALARDRGQNSGGNNLRERVLSAMNDAQWKVKGWFGIQRPRPMLMGEMAITVIPTVPTPPPSQQQNAPTPSASQK